MLDLSRSAKAIFFTGEYVCITGEDSQGFFLIHWVPGKSSRLISAGRSSALGGRTGISVSGGKFLLLCTHGISYICTDIIVSYRKQIFEIWLGNEQRPFKFETTKKVGASGLVR